MWKMVFDLLTWSCACRPFLTPIMPFMPNDELRLAAQKSQAHFSGNLICLAGKLNFGLGWHGSSVVFDELCSDTW